MTFRGFSSKIVHSHKSIVVWLAVLPTMAPMKRKVIGTAENARPSKKPRAAASATSIPKEEPAFPRGGASVLTPLEHKQIQIQAKQDVLFEQTTGQKAPKKDFEDDGEDEENLTTEKVNGNAKTKGQSKSRKKKAKASGLPLEKKIRIEGLSYKRLAPGSLVLGQIAQINRYDIALSLPNNLTGFVPITEISDVVTKKVETLAGDQEEEEEAEGSDSFVDLEALFHVGQYLRAVVLSTETDGVGGSKGKRHIALTINPRKANAALSKSDLVVNSTVQAAIASVEDHGWVMDLGLQEAGVKGFISSKELGSLGSGIKVEEGAVVLAMVTGTNANGSIVKFSLDEGKIGNIKKGAYLADAPSINAFLPGTTVDCLVSEVTSAGVIGKVMGLLDVTADLVHSGAASSGKDLEKKYAIGSKVKARIICDFPMNEEKKLGISLQDHILYWRTKTSGGTDSKQMMDPTELLPLSTTVESATVVKVDANGGLFIDLGIKGVRGFAHISKISDRKIETLLESEGPYKVGSSHKARVIGYNALDGLFIITLNPSVISQPFLRIEDVQVGQLAKGTIEKMIVSGTGVTGLVITLADGVSGMVNEMHFADVKLQQPERKFKEGMSVTGRVLSKNPEKRQIRLTLKKTLVNSDAEPWKDYQALRPGMESPGTLVKILANGAVVSFFAAVGAFLPVSEMSESFIQNPAEHFRPGQVVNVRILSVDAEAQRMTVSCKDAASFGDDKQQALADLKPGTFVNGTVSEKTTTGLVVELQPSNLKATLSVDHLTDGSLAKSENAFKKLRIGQTLNDLLVLRKDEIKRQIRLSSKPDLVKAARTGSLLKAFEDAKEGTEVVGYVNNITSTGVFVQFAGDLSALILKQHLTDDAQLLPDFGLRRDQTLAARILSIDFKQRRFLLTIRPIDYETDGGGNAKIASSKPKLSDPAEKSSTSQADFMLGQITKATINSVKDTQVNVQLAEGVQGRVDASSVYDNWEDIKDKKHPLKKFHPKEEIAVRILGMHDSRNHRFLPITNRGKAPVFELTAKQSDLEADELDVLTLDKVVIGTVWTVFVNNATEDCLWVNLSPNVRGRIRAMDITNELAIVTDLAKHFPNGSALNATVSGVDLNNGRLDLTAKEGSSSPPLTLKDLSLGQILPGRVTKVTDRQLLVQISEQVSGPVHFVDMADDYEKANPWIYRKNQMVRICIKDIDAPNKRIVLSTRPSKVLSSSLPVEDVDLVSVSQIKVNDVRRGFIKNVADNGIFVALSSSVTAFVRVANLSDLYLKDWKAGFEVDQLVKGKIVAVDEASSHVQMSLKQSHLDKDYKPPITFNSVQVGQVVTGKVRKVETFGVFIVIDNSANVSGLCHKSNMADRAVVDPTKLYEEGDVVKAKVLSINQEKRQISFGLKASYFERDGEAPAKNEGVVVGSDESDESDSDDEEDGVMLGDESDEDMKDIETEHIQSIDEDENIQEDGEEGGMSSHLDGADVSLTTGGVGLSAGGFDFTGGIPGFDDAEDQSESETDSPTARKKKRRRAEIKMDRTGDLDANGPQSLADFERLLLGRPHDSVLWLSYMAFQVQLGENDKAREIGERALKSIPISEQDEKFNVWVGMLNLEHTYGTEESLDEVFGRACQYNDSQTMHERLISIYIQSGQHGKADNLYQAGLKKHKQDPELYYNYAHFLMNTLKQAERARDVLPRAMQALPATTHLDLTKRFALLEFHSPNGEGERGRTMFETMLSQWPKRLDLWNVLIDVEKKEGDKAVVRKVFERVTDAKMKLKKKQANFYFKQWYEYEEKEGDKKGVERVKALAAKDVQRRQEQQQS